MSLKYVAEKIINEGDNSVITVGLDDTSKAAGHRMYDVKTDHITFKSETEPRKFLTTGYKENISHAGIDGAKYYQHTLKCLSLLAGCTEEDLKSQQQNEIIT